MNISTISLRAFVFLLFVCLVSISNIVTTVESYNAVVYFRYVLSAFLVIFLFIVLSKQLSTLVPAILVCILFLYNLLLLNMQGMNLSFSDVINFLSISIGVMVITYAFGEKDGLAEVERKIIHGLYLYFGFSLILHLITGGILIEIPPRFNFAYGSLLIGREENYSLGLSNFYGMMSLVFLYSYHKKYNQGSLLILCSFFSMYLSMLGGARGEFLITVLLWIALVIFYNLTIVKFIIIIPSIMFMVILLIINMERIGVSEHLSSIVFFQRMESLISGDFSSRDTLIKSAVELFYDNPICFISGCGVGFFQYYNDFSHSLYPHNFLVEMLISFGVFLTTSLLVVMCLGWVFFCKRNEGHVLSLLFVFSFLVSLKSGSMLTSWFAFSTILFFNYYYLFRITLKKLSNSRVSNVV